MSAARRIVIACVAIVVGAGTAGAHDPAPAAPPAPGVRAHEHGASEDHGADHGSGAHVHAPVPAAYRSAHVPAAAWTDGRLIERGKTIYAARCAVCHGDEGDGKGPAAAGLPLSPPSLRDARMVSEMAGNYWFWRISEGGVVEPFRSAGSAMPAWKDHLSVEDRWAVIAYQHTFSGHAGPHVTSEHPEILGPSQRHDVPATERPAPAGAHRHGGG